MPKTPKTKRPSDYIYSVKEDGDYGFGPVVSVALVEKAFFDENGHMDDCHVSEQVDGLPRCIEEEAEGFFTSTESVGVVCMQLEAAGIRFNPAFDAFMKTPRVTPGI